MGTGHLRFSFLLLSSRSLAAAAALVTGGFAFSQRIPAAVPAPQAPETPALQTNVNEVTLDLVVRDKRNRAVLDLSPSDVAVTDSGLPVKLSNLHLATPVPGSLRMITMVFDRLSSAQGKNALTIAEKIVKEIPDGEFKYAVLRSDGRLWLVQQYTTDHAAIEHALAVATESAGTNFSAESAGAEKALIAEAALLGSTAASASGVSAPDREAARLTYVALTASQQLVANQQTPPPLAALMAVSQAQREIPGRKVVLYFTVGIEADSRAAEMIRTAAGEANRAGVSLYAIDMSAMSLSANQEMMVTAAMGAKMAANYFNPPPAATQFSPGDTTPVGIKAQAGANTTDLEFADPGASSVPVGRLAEATGGRYIPAQLNLNKPVHELVEDLTTFYVATYTPPIEDYDGSFRAITVKPLRKNISVRSRSGYFALPPSDVNGARPFEMPLLSILREPQLPGEIAFDSRIVQLGTLPGGLTQELAIEAPIGNLELRKDPNAGLYSLHATLLAQVVNAAGTVVEQFSEELRRHGALDTIETARTEMLNFQRPFVAAPGAYTLKVAMLDLNSGKSSAQQTKFEVAPAISGPFLSDLVLVRRTEPVPSGRVKDIGLPDPLRSSDGAVVANLSGAIPPGTKKVSLFFIIHPGAAALGKATLEMTVAREGHVIGHAPLFFAESADNSPVPYFGTLGTGSMSTGEYVATVSLTQGKQKFERSVTLKVSGGSLQAAPASLSRHSALSSSAKSAAEADEAPEDATAELPPLVVAPAGGREPVKSPEETRQMLDHARERALAYADSLPNFLCAETTSRSIDSAGNERWKHQDSFSELLTYRNRTETRRMIEVNGHQSHDAPDDLKGVVSHGEFGGILNAIFEPSAHAEFNWKETGFVNGERVDLFEYKVAAKDSSFGLTGDNNWQIDAAFHGVVSIDAATYGVRQVTIIANDLPKGFSIHASAIRVDYNYVAINGHDYLLPTRATIRLRRRKHEGVLNEIEFHDYRRFGAKTRMVPVAQ